MSLIFLDLETTGLRADRDCILEIAAAAVDVNLNPTSGIAAVIHRPDAKSMCDSFVTEMHNKNGLFLECADPARSRGLVEVTDAVCAWLDTLGKGPHTLAGDSVHFDLSFLRVSMPRVADRFSHRLLDVSAFRVAREFRGLPSCDIVGRAHRAQSDVMASIAKARWHLSRLAP